MSDNIILCSTIRVYFYIVAPKAEALLIECCFVDDKDDVNLYNAEEMEKVIVKGITGIELMDNTIAEETTSSAIANGIWGELSDLLSNKSKVHMRLGD